MEFDKLPTLSYERKMHRASLKLFLYFEYNPDIKKIIKETFYAKYSKTHRAWYILEASEIVKTLQTKLKGVAIVSEVITKRGVLKKSSVTKGKIKNISAENRLVLKQFREYLQGKRYSESTVMTYLMLVAGLVEYHNKMDLTRLDLPKVQEYVEKVFAPYKYSINTHRQFISAMKQFHEFYGTQIDTTQLFMPKKTRYLPTVLSKEEVLDILTVTANLKHRTILALLYSCGLRISEVLNLHIRDIDIDRRQLVVRGGKGRKDRYVILAETMVPLLSNYKMTYQPNGYLIYGRNFSQYSPESIRAFLRKSCKKAKIKKRVTPHTLRHSYATHLLESGIDLRYIQELLGHAKPETTMIYTHVAKKDLLSIKSPLDIALKELATKMRGGGFLSNQ
ncbi:site-specific tyrosine recombinase/integron integrase [Jejudonia soesokkakensis]|uniref:Site-specific tyrosine recombinase/integron integrase n=1 Tax=Jejudonia soesokkakensis TaxID=1323432 RepID=A0ABW2MTV1_9FLAO